MPQSVIAAGIGGISSILGGALSSRPKTYTQTVTPTLSPEIQALASRLQQYSQDSMMNPQAGFAPIRSSAMDAINRNYMDIPAQVSAQMAARGYGSSGAMGNSLYKVALGRGGQLSDLEGQLAQAAINQRNFGAGLGQNLVSMLRGSTSTSNVPGDVAGSLFQSAGSGLENLATIMTLNKLLTPGPTGMMPSGYQQPSVASMLPLPSLGGLAAPAPSINYGSYIRGIPSSGGY